MMMRARKISFLKHIVYVVSADGCLCRSAADLSLYEINIRSIIVSPTRKSPFNHIHTYIILLLTKYTFYINIFIHIRVHKCNIYNISIEPTIIYPYMTYYIHLAIVR